MKKIIEKYGLISLLIAIFLIVFVFGGMFSKYMTEQRAAHIENNATNIYLEMFENATRAESFDTTGVVKSYFKPLSTESFTVELIESYKIFDGSNEVGVVYIVQSFGKFADLKVAYAIAHSTESIVGVMVISNNETPQYFNELETNNFFDQFDNKPLDDIGFSVDAIAGTTMSSKGIEIGMLYAREQYAVDFDFTMSSFNIYLEMFENATKAEPFDTTGVEKTYFKPLSTDTFTVELVESYKIFDGSDEVGVVYIVQSFGKFAELKVAYAIAHSNESIVGAMVISNKETPQYFNQLETNNFFDQFDNKSLDDIGFSVDAVAGATMSSKGIEIGMLYAREQYAADFDFEIPTIVMTINSLTYNLDPATFATSPYIADVTYGEENTNLVVYLDPTFTYVSTITGTEPDSDIQSTIKNNASANGLVTSASFVSYDPVTRTLVLISKGYNKTPIQGTYILNATLDGIDSFSFVSNESYDNEYNEGFNHSLGSVPYVEDNLSNQFKNDEIEIDGIAGATVTSNAMKNMLNLVKLFIEDQNGGN